MPFTEEQAPFFFGRDAEREIITANLMASRLTLLYGPSGVGKSSVLNAGVAYQLRQAARRPASSRTVRSDIVLFRTWRDDPLAGLERTIELETGVTGRGSSFGDRLQSCAEQIGGEVLIILDQFEEYFMYHPGEDGERTFAAEFARAVNRRDLRASFLVSMREDSIAKLDFFKARIPNLFDNYLRIDRLTREQAREAIVGPIEQFNRMTSDPVRRFDIEPTLAEAVLDQVRANPMLQEGKGLGTVGDSPDPGIETPHLQLVMTRLWQEEVSTGSRRLRLQTLERLGGSSEIVKRHVDSALDALTPGEREAAARIFQYLVTPAGTKIALGVDDLSPNAGMSAPQLRALLVKLSSGENRILTPVAPAPDQPARERYQIFHDVLAEKVLEWRSRYVKDAEKRAAEAVAEEERRRAEAEARTAARLRRLLRFVAALLIVAAGASIGAWFAWRQAQIERRRADAERAGAEVANHTAEAGRLQLLKANEDNAALAAKAARLEAENQLAAAQRQGSTAQTAVLTQRIADFKSKETDAQQNAARFAQEAAKEQKAADLALAQEQQIQAQLGGSPVQTTAPPMPDASAKLPDAVAVNPPTPPVTAPPPNPAPDVDTPKLNPPTPGTTPGNAAPVNRGDYRETYRKAIDAKNRKQWSDAASLFRAALALRGTDTGERINISGFGNIEPYVPHYYLGLALMNMNDCKGALENWDLAEHDGAIQKTPMYKSMQQSRATCEKQP